MTVPSKPKGIPTAIAQSPTRILSELPSFAAGNLRLLASILITATSVLGSRPTTLTFLPLYSVLSDNLTTILS